MTATRLVYLDINKKHMKQLNYTSAKRLDMVSQGAYDGRFKNRVVTDKKKQQSKTAARKWKLDRDF
jgi:hypothetical protein